MLGGCHSYLVREVVVRARVEGWRVEAMRRGSTHGVQDMCKGFGLNAESIDVLTNHLWPRIVPTRHIVDSELLLSHTVMSDSLRPHELQHARLPCLSLSPGVCSDSCPLSRWCHPTISSSATPFSFCPHSFPLLGSSSMSQLFASGGQSIGVSASTPVLLMNIQDWFPLGLTGLISLQFKGLSRVYSSTIHNSSALSLLYGPPLTFVHDYWKNHNFDCMDLHWQSGISTF